LIAWDIASGLLEIHSHKIAHRDLKPENILVKTENINGQPKLRFKISDFGAAKSINAALEE
jgi:serine/threonine protein kinase